MLNRNKSKPRLTATAQLMNLTDALCEEPFELSDDLVPADRVKAAAIRRDLAGVAECTHLMKDASDVRSQQHPALRSEKANEVSTKRPPESE